MSIAPQRALYPRYCFHLSPTANAWCLMRSSELHALEQHDEFSGEGFFFLSNLPIKWVRVVGIVVAIDQFANKRCFTIDDSSGMCIEALINLPSDTKTQSATASERVKTAAPSAETYDHVEVGHAVDVKGQLTVFRDERQIRVEKITVVKSTTQEIGLWEKRTKFRREVLGKSWVVGDKQMRRCRREAERSDAKSERKKQRLKAIATRSIGRGETSQKDNGDKGQGKESKKSSIKMEELLRIAALGEGDYSALGL